MGCWYSGGFFGGFNENLNDGINDLLKIYGSNFRVPPTEKTLVGSWSPDKVLSDWSQEMKRAVASCFEDFIDLFGYEFPGESTIKHSLIDTKGLRLKNFKRIR